MANKKVNNEAPKAVQLVECDACHGVGVDMSVSEKKLCAPCKGSGQVEVK